LRRKLVKPEDLAKITLVSGPAASSREREAAFVVTRIDLESDRYVSRI